MSSGGPGSVPEPLKDKYGDDRWMSMVRGIITKLQMLNSKSFIHATEFKETVIDSTKLGDNLWSVLS